MQNFIKGVLGSFAIHLIFGLLAFGLVFFFTSDFANASEQLLLELADADDQEAQVLATLAAARDQLAGWIWPVMVMSFLCSILFLGMAQLSMPATPREEHARKGLWAGLIVGLTLFTIGCWWFMVASPQASYPLLAGNYALILTATFALILLGYFLSTALFVKPTMVPSVPLASLFRGR